MRSDSIKFGPEAAAHRSLYNALGWTDEEISRPLVGIVSSFNEVVPSHINIDKITDAVKMGIAMAGGMPRGLSRHRRLRRHRHGSHRHEVLARDP